MPRFLTAVTLAGLLGGCAVYPDGSLGPVPSPRPAVVYAPPPVAYAPPAYGYGYSEGPPVYYVPPPPPAPPVVVSPSISLGFGWGGRGYYGGGGYWGGRPYYRRW